MRPIKQQTQCVSLMIFILSYFYDYDNTGNRFEIISPIHIIIDYLIFDRTITENYIINNIISNKESFFE